MARQREPIDDLIDAHVWMQRGGREGPRIMQFNVRGSIILLFATDKKWDLNNIKLKAVTAQGIFFDASCPALVIDQTAKKPIRLGDADEVLDAAGRDVSSDRLEKDYGWHSTPDEPAQKRAFQKAMAGARRRAGRHLETARDIAQSRTQLRNA
jgi:hypothetical protein